jgi:uncharacterized protein
MARIAIKVHPRAKRTAITGRLGEAYKLDLKAPPADGKANEECIRFFAEALGVKRNAVRILQGAAGRMKMVEIEGVEMSDIEGRLGADSHLRSHLKFAHAVIIHLFLGAPRRFCTIASGWLKQCGAG